MGSCAHKRNIQPQDCIVMQLQYSRQGFIKVKNRKSAVPSSLTGVAFHLSEPCKVYSDELLLFSNFSFISLAVLPGIDPIKDTEKICQDNCFFLTSSSSLLIGLFDGHGVFGTQISKFCCELCQSLFTQQSQFTDPLEYLKFLTFNCEKGLKSSEINTSLSGCTQVLVFLTQKKIFCCSLGDSRAVLGTSKLPDQIPCSYNSQFYGNVELEQMKKRRNSVNCKYIFPVQLTFDQKPDLPEEKARVLACGGKVDKLKNCQNQPVGPFRVFDPAGQYPGISVSRALGDSKLRDLGIISEPVLSTHCLSDNDYFIVIASDGIWDVMDNEDVTNFVENYRNACKRKVRASVQGHLVNPGNSCIAQMLCEEARVRWFSLLKDEDVSIDDISCVVFEIKDTPIEVKMGQIGMIGKGDEANRRSLVIPNSGEFADI